MIRSGFGGPNRNFVPSVPRGVLAAPDRVGPSWYYDLIHRPTEIDSREIEILFGSIVDVPVMAVVRSVFERRIRGVFESFEWLRTGISVRSQPREKSTLATIVRAIPENCRRNFSNFSQPLAYVHADRAFSRAVRREFVKTNRLGVCVERVNWVDRVCLGVTRSRSARRNSAGHFPRTHPSLFVTRRDPAHPIPNYERAQDREDSSCFAKIRCSGCTSA